MSGSDSHTQGLGGAVYLGNDPTEIISCGRDGRICVRDADAIVLDKVPRLDDTPINCIAAHARQQYFATTDDKNCVHVYRYPENKSTLAARLLLPGMLLSFSGTGEKLVAGGSDEMLHIIMIRPDSETGTLKAQVLRKLKAVPHSRGLAFDPEGEYIAALAASGMLQIWDVMDGKQVLSRKQIGPDVVKEKGMSVGLAWSPDGDALAVASQDNSISLFKRSNWELKQTLSSSQDSPVCCIKFSPNGVYLASAGQSHKVVVYAVSCASVIAEKTFEARILSMDWKPEANTLLCMLHSGELVLWDEVISDGQPTPCEAVEKPVSSQEKSAGSPERPVSGQEREDSVVPSRSSPRSEAAAQSADDFSADSYGRPTSTAGKNIEDRSLPEIEDGFDAIMRDAGNWTDNEAEPEKSVSGGGGYQQAQAFQMPKLQEPFQPASTALHGGRRWLAYNMTGGISMKEDEGIAILETVFHDTVANSRRIAPFRDFHGFTMASLGERGALFAREGNAREEARLMFRHHNALYPNSEWTLNLPLGIRIQAITAGRSSVAAATSDRQLHIFTTAGLEIGLRTLPGPVVALAAHANLLAAVWHSGIGLESGESHLEFVVLDVNYRTLVSQGQIPLSAGSELQWMGFSEEGLLATWDSEGILRLRTEEFGGSWVSLASADLLDKDPEQIWPVALTKSDFFYIACKSDEAPAVLPRPSLSKLPLRPDVLSGSEGQVAALEADWIRLAAYLALLRAKQEDEAFEENLQDVIAEELEEQTACDRVLLKLFQDALKTSRLQRAQELAACLHLQRSLEGALKLTNLHRIPVLAGAITKLIAGREEEAAQQEVQQAFSTPQTTIAALHQAAEPSNSRPPSSTGKPAAGPDQGRKENIPLQNATGNPEAPGHVIARNRSGPLKELSRNALFGSEKADDQSGKRKAASNPFARKPKVQKEER